MSKQTEKKKSPKVPEQEPELKTEEPLSENDEQAKAIERTAKLQKEVKGKWQDQKKSDK